MSAVQPWPLAFQVGARTLWRIERRLVRVPLGLEAVLGGAAPVLPSLPDDADGYLVTSLPEHREAVMVFGAGDLLAWRRQGYVRYHIDLGIGFDAWLAQLSGNARSGLKRKARRIAALSGGALDVRRYATPAELEDFHAVARPIAERTYQERLLGAALPGDAGFVAGMLRAAAADRVRAWTLAIGGEPAAYLYCAAQGSTLTYDYVGHDPAFADWSPGAVLHQEALRDLFAEGRFARFDFTEGEGQHKRQMATGGTACVDLLLLRPTLANRGALTALRGFDRAVSLAKEMAARPALRGIARRLRRG